MTNFSSNFEPSIACLKIAHVIFFWGKICWKVAKEANFPNLLAHFFLPKFFIKFSRVTNRHLARINLLLVENFGNSSPSVFMIFLFFFVDFFVENLPRFLPIAKFALKNAFQIAAWLQVGGYVAF